MITSHQGLPVKDICRRRQVDRRSSSRWPHKTVIVVSLNSWVLDDQGCFKLRVRFLVQKSARSWLVKVFVWVLVWRYWRSGKNNTRENRLEGRLSWIFKVVLRCIGTSFPQNMSLSFFFVSRLPRKTKGQNDCLGHWEICFDWQLFFSFLTLLLSIVESIFCGHRVECLTLSSKVDQKTQTIVIFYFFSLRWNWWRCHCSHGGRKVDLQVTPPSGGPTRRVCCVTKQKNTKS